MTRRISLDATKESVVVRCSDCPWWYGFAFSRKEGWEVARRHEQRAHPGSTQATTALSNYR